jgi:preprotein translocase subunit SecE
MATVSEGSESGSSLFSELFAGKLHKPKQGRIVRQVTCLALWLSIWLGAWQLYETLGSYSYSDWSPSTRDLLTKGTFVLPALLVILGMWFSFRLVNWPKFAEFLIAVEAEMTKVSWPTKTELYRASMVVIFTMAFLALLLFAYDMVWQAIFDGIGVS